MFEDGTDFQDIFDTPQGPVRVLAEVHIVDLHLTLNEVLFFPDNSEDRLDIGVRKVLFILRAIRILARDSGFEQMTAIYHRIGGKHDGRIIIHTRTLR